MSDETDNLIVCSNGAVKGENGKFIAMDNSKNPHAITKENTQLMHKLRRERAREATLRGIARGAKVDDPMLGIEMMTGKLTEMVMDKNSKAAEQYRAVMGAAGFGDERGQPQGDAQPSGVQINVPVEALVELLNAANRLLEGQKGAEEGSGQVIEG